MVLPLHQRLFRFPRLKAGVATTPREQGRKRSGYPALHNGGADLSLRIRSSLSLSSASGNLLP
jgi:hypothetical protein